MKTQLSALPLCGLVLCCASSAFAIVQYQLTELPLSPGGTDTQTNNITNNGKIAGQQLRPSISTIHAAVFEVGGGVSDVNDLIAPYPNWLGWVQYSSEVNASGQIAAYGYTATGQGHAMFYSNGTITDLGTFGGDWSFAEGINSFGHVVGRASQGVTYRAFVYSGGSISPIPGLGGASSSAGDINDAGQIVGYAFLPGNIRRHAFLRTAGQTLDLGTLGGDSDALAINEAGQAVGFSNLTDDSAGPYHAVLFDQGAVIDLGTLGGLYGTANAINELGQIVGTSRTSGGADHAFLYQNSVMTDLNSLVNPGSGWQLVCATGINDNGLIVGWGTNAAGQQRGFLLTPIPEPAMASLALPATLWTALRTRRRRSGIRRRLTSRIAAPAQR